MRALIPGLSLALLVLSGCFGGSGGDGFDFEPGTDYKPTGNVVHLKMSVVDMDIEVYPGFVAWQWAFCVEPFDPNDEYSKAAIEYWDPLPGDKVIGGDQQADPSKSRICSVPAPTIRVKQGDTVKVEFSNSHFHSHTIHWHGQLVPWDQDGAPGVSQDMVRSGSSFTYEFEAKKAGTLWYHCHVDTQLHIMQGLYGMFIVEPQETQYEPKDIDREYYLVLGTANRATLEGPPGANRHGHPPGCGASGLPGCENPPSQAGEVDVFTINAHSYPYTMDHNGTLIKMKEGERIRLRLLNTGETPEQIHPHGHDMLVTHVDGSPLQAPYWADTVIVGSASRVDVVIEANNPGPWMIHTHVSSHETNCAKAPGGMHTMMVYDGFEDQMHRPAEANEQTAQCPFGSVVKMPSDFVNSTAIVLGTHQYTEQLAGVPGGFFGQATAGWHWPVELACGVRKLAYHVQLQAPEQSMQRNDLQVKVKIPDPSGGEPTAVDLGRLGPDGVKELSYVLEGKAETNPPSQDPTWLGQVRQGNYTVEVVGNSVEATLHMSIIVDYYEDFDQSKLGHLETGAAGCLGFT